jgi:excisionase family DNA binding protein
MHTMSKPTKSQASDTQELPVIGYTKADAARMLTISSRSLDHLIKRGQIRIVKLGRRVIVPASVLHELMDA